MERRIRSTLPINLKRLIPSLLDTRKLKEREEKKRKNQKKNYDSHYGVRTRDELKEKDVEQSKGYRVWIKDLRVQGNVFKKAAAPTYIINTPGGQFRRNMFYLIPIPSNPEEQISKEGDQAKSQKSQGQSPKEGGNEKVTRQPEKEESIGPKHQE